MEWQIKRIARQSVVSGHEFRPGDRLVCVLYVEPEEGHLARADMLSEEADRFEAPGEILGRWTRTVRDTEDDDASQTGGVAGAEELFVSLFQETPDSGSGEERAALQHLLALMLERKRILKREDARAAGRNTQRYRHVRRQETFDVPVVSISREMVLKIEDTLGDIVG